MVDGEDGSGDVTPAPREHTTLSTTRRDVIRSIGAGALGAAFAAGASPVAAQMAQGHPEVQPGTPPLQGVRVIERSAVLSGRLAGLLLADQGAEVFVERGTSITPGGLDDNFFDRGKIAVPPGAGADAASADLVIVDGTAETARTPHQVLVRFMAALPGDEAYGYLPLRLPRRAAGFPQPSRGTQRLPAWPTYARSMFRARSRFRRCGLNPSRI